MRTIKSGGNEVHLLGNQIKVGDKAVDVRLCTNDFNEMYLSDYFGKRIVIATFLSVDTGVCASETRRFNLEASKMSDLVVITVSKDLPFALARFCAADGIKNVITTSDYRYNDFGENYGFLMDETKLLARGCLYIDEDCIVRYVDIVEETDNEPDYAKLLEFLKTT